MTQALLVLIDSLAAFLTILLLLRFLMQWFRVSFANQLGKFVVQLTNWLVMPLRRVLPGVFGLDLASLLPAMLLQALVATAFLSLSALPVDPSLFALLIARQALLGTLRLVIYLLIGALILQAVLSWVNPYSPLGPVVHQFTRPLLAPIQRFVPPIANIDLSPLVAILALQLVLIFV